MEIVGTKHINMNTEQKLITILGPTATGKTRIATRLAYELGGEILSADSRQVYRRMDIGTGKDLEDYTYNGTQIPYHLIDIEDPGKEYNLFKFQQAAHAAIDEIRKKGKPIIMCGGSGMYIEAIVKGYKLFPVPENPQLKAELDNTPEEKLIQMLASYRPLHNHTDTCEHNRLVHAIILEKYYAEHPELQEISTAHPSLLFGIKGDRDLIRNRITLRLKERLENGMIEEVKSLIDSGVDPQQLIRYGLEYKFITLYIQNEISYDFMFEKLNIAIHQFSKRQMTWFRKMEREGFKINWLDVAWSEEQKIDFIMQRIK